MAHRPSVGSVYSLFWYSLWARNGFYIFKKVLKKQQEEEDYVRETICDLQSLKYLQSGAFFARKFVGPCQGTWL